MRHTASFLALPFLSLAACGGRGAPTPPSEPNGVPVPASAAESPVLFAAERGGSLFVVSARADTGEVTAFGPALTQGSDAYDIANVHVSVDGTRVVVALMPKVGTPGWTSLDSVVVLGDGATWQTLAHAPDLVVQSAADDLSLVVAAYDCPAGSGTANSQVVVIRSDGAHVFDDKTCMNGKPAAFVESIAPDGSYFVVRTGDGALTLHTVDGRQVALTAPGTSAIVGQTFATSLLLGDAPRARWVDTAGQPIEVAGWASAVSTPTGLQMLNGALYALQDRGMRRVAAVPPGADPTTIVGVRGDLVLTRAVSFGPTDVLDASGAVVASYTPTPAHAASHDPTATATTIVSSRASSTTSNDAWTVFEDWYETTSPGVSGADVYEKAEDLWLFVDGTGHVGTKTVELRRAAIASGSSTAWPTRGYVSSSTGAYVLFTDSGTLHALDVDSGADHPLATDFVMASVGGGITRHTGP